MSALEFAYNHWFLTCFLAWFAACPVVFTLGIALTGVLSALRGNK